MNELAGTGRETSEPGRGPAAQDVHRAPDREQPSAAAKDSIATVSRRGPAEPLTRGEYADLMRQGPAPRTGRGAPETESTTEDSHAIVPDTGAARLGLAGPPTREETAEQAGSGTGPARQAMAVEQPAAAGPGKITHYIAEFRGQRVDLVTDGTHWAETGNPRPSRETSPLLSAGPDEPEGGGQREPERARGTTVSFEDRSVEVTDNADDGIWVEGLPGEPPGQAGDLLVSPEDDKRSRGDRLFAKAVDNAEDLFDAIEKNASLGFEALQRPPVHAETAVPASHHPPEAPASPDAGNLATAALALGYLTWAAGRQIHQRMRDSSP